MKHPTFLTLPNRTTTGRRVSLAQCAAVSMNSSDMRVPPQSKLILYD